MPDFNAKMHQIRFRLGLRPRPRRGAYSAPPDPLAGFKGPTSKGREGREGRGREGSFVPPLSKFLATPLLVTIIIIITKHKEKMKIGRHMLKLL